MNEGQFAQVVCIVTEGDEPLKLSWSLQGETVSSEAGLSTTSLGTRTSMLTIQSVGYGIVVSIHVLHQIMLDLAQSLLRLK